MYKKIILVLFFLSAFIIPPFIGEHSFTNIFSEQNQYILLHIRLPRIVFAFAVGAGLALIGTVFQALLKNDLATPYTLGVSSGGSLGAVLAIKTGLEFHFLGFSTVTLFSMAASVTTLFLVYFIAYQKRGFSSFSLILAGVTISLFFSAFILFIHYLADFTETYRMVRWLMGALDVAGWYYALFLLFLLIAVFIYFMIQVKAFNLLLTGDDLAKSKGVDVKQIRIVSFILASVLIGGIVSLAGPIGFIGLIIPHILRLQLGPDHRKLFPAAVLTGGAFLIWCDTFARMIIYPAELPVGIITALFGGPFFIYLLVRKR